MGFAGRVYLARELPGLLDLAAPPSQLFLHGTRPLGPVVALVGTRRPSAEGAAFAARLAAELVRAGVVVASGGAEGIDTAAHQGALRAGGSTVVVAPCGYERPYPESNAALFQEIVAKGGAYISEFEATQVARRHQFFRRNAILVALSQVTVVVESPPRSGARNAALWARRLGRPLFAVPHAPWNPRGGGNLQELRLGAKLLLSSRDVLRCLESMNQHSLPLDPESSEVLLTPPSRRAKSKAPVRILNNDVEGRLDAEAPDAGEPSDVAAPLSLSATRALAALQGAPLHLDELGERAQLNAAAVHSAVTELCLAGETRLLPGGFVLRVTP